MGKILDFIKRTWAENKAFYETEKQAESFGLPSVSCESASFEAPKSISNEEYQAMRQKEAQHWEEKYDLSTVQGISAIPVPKCKVDSCGTGSTTGQIEYYLIHKAGCYENEGRVELALACYRKANELMPMSAVSSYPRDTYMRLPRYLRKLCRFEEAEEEEGKIDALFGGNYRFIEERDWLKRRNAQLFMELRQFDTDLVETSYVRCCCAECAKYRERVYSLSGLDHRFPKLPEYLLFTQHDCGIQLYSFIDGVNHLHTHNGKELCGQQVIRYSNRPFIDDRTPDELADLERMKQRQRAEAEAREQFLASQREREKYRVDYDWLTEFIPELCPKSFSGYMRMRNANTKNYQKIAAEAQKLGKILK